MTSKHHSITPGWLRSSPGEISSPVSERFGSPILARYLAMSVDGMCERMCIQKDSWAGDSDFVWKMIRMSVERVVATRRPCLRFEMARSLPAAVFFAEAFAMVADEGERRCSRGKPSVILPPASHEPHPRLVSAYAPSNEFPFFLHRRFEVQTKTCQLQTRSTANLSQSSQKGNLPPSPPHACYSLRLYPSGPVAFRSHLASCLIPRLIYLCRLYFTTFLGSLPKPQNLNTHSSEFKPPPIRDTGHGASGSRTEPTPEADSQASYYYFTLDDDLFYLSFYQDWGPLNMAMVYRACILIHELLEASVPLRSDCLSVLNLDARGVG